MNIAERLPVAPVDRAAPIDGVAQVFELQQPKRRLILAHLAVDSRGDDCHLVGKAKILKVVDALLGLRITAYDRATFKGAKNLSGMEAQYAEIRRGCKVVRSLGQRRKHAHCRRSPIAHSGRRWTGSGQHGTDCRRHALPGSRWYSA